MQKQKSVFRKSLLAGAFLLSAMVVSGVHVANAQSSVKVEASDDSKEAVDQMCQKITEAFNSNKIFELLDQYTDDATVITPEGKKIKGRKEIAAYYGDLKGVKDFKIDVSEVTGSGKMISVLGKTTMSVEKNGTSAPREANFVLVLKRVDNWDYKIFLDSSNFISLSYNSESK